MALFPKLPKLRTQKEVEAHMEKKPWFAIRRWRESKAPTKAPKSPSRQDLWRDRRFTDRPFDHEKRHWGETSRLLK